MNYWTVSRSSLKGTIKAPPSKSQTFRALYFALMARGKSVIEDPLFSDDTKAMIAASRNLGAKVEVFPNRIEVLGLSGKIIESEDVIQAGNSGLVFRFMTALGAFCKQPLIVTGDDSIRNRRPIAPLLEALNQLGASAFSLRKKGGAPVLVQGFIKNNFAALDGKDSQPVSALLSSLIFAKEPIQIFVRNPGEKPWVNLTLKWFERLGIPYSCQEYEKYKVFGNACYEGFYYKVPGDYSSASFAMAAAVITNSEIVIENLDPSDPQGDKIFVSILQKMGANIEIDEESKKIFIQKSSGLQGISIDVNDCIDAIPLLATVACFAEGKTHLFGGQIAHFKESDRIQCTALELKKMGADIEETRDGLIVKRSSLQGAELKSHSDHRLAMAFTVAASAVFGITKIDGIKCVAKSYPEFFKDLKKLNLNFI